MMPTPMGGGGTLKPWPPERLGVRPVHQMATTVPQFSTMVDVDMTLTSALREYAEPVFKQQAGVSLGFTPFLIKAAAKGLRACPEVHGTMMPTGLWLHDRIQMGVVMLTPKGLIIPVIRDPDVKSVGQIALELDDFMQRGSQGQLRPDEFMPSTFCISNGGSLGISRSIPMVIPPHVSMFGIGAITKQPRAVKDAVAIRSVMEVCLACDHRAVDGEHAGRFLDAFRETVETAQYA